MLLQSFYGAFRATSTVLNDFAPSIRGVVVMAYSVGGRDVLVVKANEFVDVDVEHLKMVDGAYSIYGRCGTLSRHGQAILAEKNVAVWVRPNWSHVLLETEHKPTIWRL